MNVSPIGADKWLPSDDLAVGSKKTPVFEFLFHYRWDGDTGEWQRRYDPEGDGLLDRVVTLADVQEAIDTFNRHGYPKLSTRNPANVYKDFVRRGAHANQYWPSRVWELGWTGRQLTGDGCCFRFRPAGDQPVPFLYAEPSDELLGTQPVPIQSLSLPLASRMTGRSDESWLVQVLVRLNLVELHFGLSHPEPLQVDHLQTGIKLKKSEIDALYLLTTGVGGGRTKHYFVTLEAKGRSDGILYDQLIAQAESLAASEGVDCHPIVPLAIKAIGPSLLYLVEFQTVTHQDVFDVDELQLVRESLFRFAPEVPGIGKRGKGTKRSIEAT